MVTLSNAALSDLFLYEMSEGKNGNSFQGVWKMSCFIKPTVQTQRFQFQQCEMEKMFTFWKKQPQEILTLAECCTTNGTVHLVSLCI